MTIEPEDTIIFQADQLEGKDLDNTRRKALFVIQASRLQDGKLVSGEPQQVLFKREVFNCQQTIATDFPNVISGVVNDVSVAGRLSTWLGISEKDLIHYTVEIELKYQLQGDSVGTDDITVILDALGGSVNHFTIDTIGSQSSSSSKKTTTVYPISDIDSGKIYDFLYVNFFHFSLGETHNVTVVLTASKLPANVAIPPSRALV
ncbi:hypothetical protein KAR91_09335 [Candidatus Pacearchaeota archaeon]|nr:hypothetical protein [Candidatus Pacearchaeota archaeon]